MSWPPSRTFAVAGGKQLHFSIGRFLDRCSIRVASLQLSGHHTLRSHSHPLCRTGVVQAAAFGPSPGVSDLSCTTQTFSSSCWSSWVSIDSHKIANGQSVENTPIGAEHCARVTRATVTLLVCGRGPQIYSRQGPPTRDSVGETCRQVDF